MVKRDNCWSQSHLRLHNFCQLWSFVVLWAWGSNRSLVVPSLEVDQWMAEVKFVPTKRQMHYRAYILENDAADHPSQIMNYIPNGERRNWPIMSMTHPGNCSRLQNDRQVVKIANRTSEDAEAFRIRYSGDRPSDPPLSDWWWPHCIWILTDPREYIQKA